MLSRSMIVLCALILSNGSLFATPSNLPESLLKKKREIYDLAASLPSLRNWIDSRMRAVLKDPLDAQVDEILKNSRVVRSLLPDVMKQIDGVVVGGSIEHMRDAALVTMGKNGQYQWLGELMDQLAADMNFSPKARQNMQIWVVAHPSQNAYTFSGDRERIRVVFYEGLLNQMARKPVRGADGLTRYQDVGELRQVGGHELFHIKGGHIENRLMLYAIFFATGKNLIPPEELPEEDDDARDTKATKKREVRAVLRKMATKLVPHADEFLAGPYVERIAEVIEGFSKTLVKRMGQAAVDRLSKSIFRTVRGLAVDEPVEIDIKALKEFEEDMERLCRSQEASCDNAGYLVTRDHKASVLSYARLGGGAGVTYEAVMAQADGLARLFNEDPALEAEYGRQEGTHPVLAARTKQFDIFRHTEAYKTYSDEFRRVLSDYLALSKTLLELERRIYSRNQMELTDRGNLAVNRDDLIQLAKLMGDWIEEAVITDIVLAQANPGNEPKVFIGLLEGLRDAVSDPAPESDTDEIAGFDLQIELGKKRRLVQNLIEKLKSKDVPIVSKVRASVVRALENVVPSQAYYPVLGAECVVELLKAGQGIIIPTPEKKSDEEV